MIIRPYRQRAWLYYHYVICEKSLKTIAKESKCTWQTIQSWCKLLDIPVRPKGYNSGWAKGRILTEEHKLKIGDAQRRENGHWWGVRGADHPNWKGGITKKNHILRTRREYEDWRKAVLERDGYACVNCLDYPEHPHVHHIIPFIDCPDELYEKSNGATLCGECHRHIHMTEY